MSAGRTIPVPDPTIGRWYRRPNGQLFEVVAVDEDDETIEVQFFDGTIDEIDIETWANLLVENVAAPEDWTGSVDMDPDDFTGAEDGELPVGYHDPLEFLDKAD
jgi:hypothetical protein